MLLAFLLIQAVLLFYGLLAAWLIARIARRSKHPDRTASTFALLMVGACCLALAYYARQGDTPPGLFGLAAVLAILLGQRLKMEWKNRRG